MSTPFPAQSNREPDEWDLLKSLFPLVVLVASFFVIIQGHIVHHLLHTGRGLGAFPLWLFALCSGSLLLLANSLQSLAGDMVFLMWAGFTIKWIVDLVWAIRRRKAGSFEHSQHPGVVVLAPIGISGSLTAYVAAIGFGLLLIFGFREIGWAVGLILVTGGIAELLNDITADVLNARDARREHDRHVEAEYYAAAQDRGHRRETYHDVES